MLNANLEPLDAWQFTQAIKLAGFAPIDAIAEYVGLTREQVDITFLLLGIPASMEAPALRFCPSCGKWRATIDRGGSCRVCRMKEQTDLAERRIADELRDAPPEIILLYSKTETRLHATKKIIPLKRSDYETEREYVIATEAAEIALLQKGINRRKTRLKRIREHLGTNPKKGSQLQR